MPKAKNVQKSTQTVKPRKYHAEFRLTESWRFRDENPDTRRYCVNYESKFKPRTDEHIIDFWEEVVNCFGTLKTPYDEKIRLYRKSDDEAAPLNEGDKLDIDTCEKAFKNNDEQQNADGVDEEEPDDDITVDVADSNVTDDTTADIDNDSNS